MNFKDILSRVFVKKTQYQHQTEKVSEETKSESSADIGMFDFEKMAKDERIEIERRFKEIPQKDQIRLDKNHLITLSEYLNKVYGISPTNIYGLYVVTDGWEGKTIRHIDNFIDYGLLDDYFRIDNNDCLRLGEARNVMLCVSLAKNSITRLIIHMRGCGLLGPNAYLLMKISLLVFKDNGEVERDLKYITFDMSIPRELIAEIDSIHANAVRKATVGADLTREEALSMGFISPAYEKEYAESVIKESRWGDAISILTEVFNFLKKQLYRNDKDEQLRKFMGDVFHSLGLCYSNIGLHDTALYYMELAYSLNTIVFDDFVSSMVRSRDIRSLSVLNNSDLSQFNQFNDVTFTEPSKFGTILQSCFHILPSELSSMLIVYGDDPSKTLMIESQREIWSFNFIDAMGESEQITAYISYRSYQGVVAEEFKDKNSEVHKNFKGGDMNTVPYSSVDKSKSRVDNDIVVNFSKKQINGHSYVLMSVLIPEFQLSKNNNRGIPVGGNYLFITKDIMDYVAFDKIRNETHIKLTRGEKINEIEYFSYGYLTEARYHLILGSAAWNNHVWGDALFHLMKAHRLFAEKFMSGINDGNSKELINLLCFRIGFLFCDLKLYPQAVSYLSRISDTPNIHFQIEYINSLCNSDDYRTYYVVKDRLDSFERITKNLPIDATKGYVSFLQRRYAFCLIEKRMLQEAKKFLIEMLNGDEQTKRFAEEELNYLRTHYNIF